MTRAAWIASLLLGLFLAVKVLFLGAVREGLEEVSDVGLASARGNGKEPGSLFEPGTLRPSEANPRWSAVFLRLGIEGSQAVQDQFVRKQIQGCENVIASTLMNGLEDPRSDRPSAVAFVRLLPELAMDSCATSQEVIDMLKFWSDFLTAWRGRGEHAGNADFHRFLSALAIAMEGEIGDASSLASRLRACKAPAEVLRAFFLRLGLVKTVYMVPITEAAGLAGEGFGEHGPALIASVQGCILPRW